MFPGVLGRGKEGNSRFLPLEVPSADGPWLGHTGPGALGCVGPTQAPGWVQAGASVRCLGVWEPEGAGLGLG